MKYTALSIYKRFTGYGHYKITLVVEDSSCKEYEFSETTTDMQAVDDWDEQTDDYPETGAIELAGRIIDHRNLDVDIERLKRQYY